MTFFKSVRFLKLLTFQRQVSRGHASFLILPPRPFLTFVTLESSYSFLICWFIQQILTPTFYFLLLLRWFFKICFQHVTHVTNVMRGHALVCGNVCGCVGRCAQVCLSMRRYVRVCVGVCWCGWVYMSVHNCVWVCMGLFGCVWEWWDKYSEYLLETRFLTSANYNTHPLRIFSIFLFFCLFLQYMNLTWTQNKPNPNCTQTLPELNSTQTWPKPHANLTELNSKIALNPTSTLPKHYLNLTQTWPDLTWPNLKPET